VVEILVSFFKTNEHTNQPQVEATPSQTFASFVWLTAWYMFHNSYESNLCWGFIPAIFSGILESRWQSQVRQAQGHSEPAHTSGHQPLDACFYSVVDEPQVS
jgi:hypothetical protein